MLLAPVPPIDISKPLEISIDPAPLSAPPTHPASPLYCALSVYKTGSASHFSQSRRLGRGGGEGGRDVLNFKSSTRHTQFISSSRTPDTAGTPKGELSRIRCLGLTARAVAFCLRNRTRRVRRIFQLRLDRAGEALSSRCPWENCKFSRDRCVQLGVTYLSGKRAGNRVTNWDVLCMPAAGRDPRDWFFSASALAASGSAAG